MNIAQKKRIEAAIGETIPNPDKIVVGRTIIIKPLEDERSGEITFDQLSQLSERFGTTKIDINLTAGFSGTEVTPGYSGKAYIIIRDWSFMEEFHA